MSKNEKLMSLCHTFSRNSIFNFWTTIIFLRNEWDERKTKPKYRSISINRRQSENKYENFLSIFVALWLILNPCRKRNNSSIFQARIIVCAISPTGLILYVRRTTYVYIEWTKILLRRFVYYSTYILCCLQNPFIWIHFCTNICLCVADAFFLLSSRNGTNSDHIKWATLFCSELLWLLSFYLQRKSDENKMFSTTMSAAVETVQSTIEWDEKWATHSFIRLSSCKESSPNPLNRIEW